MTWLMGVRLRKRERKLGSRNTARVISGSQRETERRLSHDCWCYLWNRGCFWGLDYTVFTTTIRIILEKQPLELDGVEAIRYLKKREKAFLLQASS